MTPRAASFRSAHAEGNGFSPRDGFRLFDPADAESEVGARFREAARRHGSALAVADGDRRVSYQELLERAGSVAAHLRTRRRGPGGILTLCLPPGLEAVEGMLGALLAGCGYFCLDPSLPLLQLEALLRAAGAVTVAGALGQPDWRGHIDGLETRGPGGIAALYATSGSTGEPKLAALPHRAILFDVGRQTNDLYLGPDDRLDSLFSPAFSASLATIFGALLNGAELHFGDAHVLLGLRPWLQERRITVSTMTVSMLRHLCAAPAAGDFPDLRLLSVGGETLRAADVAAFHSAFPPHTVLQNALASTEVRTYAQYFVPRTEPVPDPVPVGWPVAGKQVRLIDEDGGEAPPGAEGEIVVRSCYLAAGYSNDAQRTALKFHQEPDGSVCYRTGDRGRFLADGRLVHLGRTDSQVKIRGHRVELEPVARELDSHPAVASALAVAAEDSFGGQRLAAYIVLRPGCTVSLEELRDFLRPRLPAHALPSALLYLDQLPLSANGKVDRRRLPPAFPRSADGPAPTDPAPAAIEILRGLWTSILQRKEVADDQDFAAAGGDSLDAVRLLSAIHDRFQCEIPADALRCFPTLRLLAGFVERSLRGEAGGDSWIEFQTGSGCPIFFVAGLEGSAAGFTHLAAQIASRHREQDHPVYGLNTRTRLGAAPEVSVESMAAAQAVQIEGMVPRGGKAIVAGHSFGATVAFETARQLRQHGLVDALPVLIDMPALNAPGRTRPTAGDRVLDVLSNLPAWIPYEAANFNLREFLVRGYGRLRRTARVLARRPDAQELDPAIYFARTSLPLPYAALVQSMHAAMRAYVPPAFPGRMVLLRARVPTLFQERDPFMGWTTVATGGVDLAVIPGRHTDCASLRYAPELADTIARYAVRFASGGFTSGRTRRPARPASAS